MPRKRYQFTYADGLPIAKRVAATLSTDDEDVFRRIADEPIATLEEYGMNKQGIAALEEFAGFIYLKDILRYTVKELVSVIDGFGITWSRQLIRGAVLWLQGAEPGPRTDGPTMGPHYYSGKGYPCITDPHGGIIRWDD